MKNEKNLTRIMGVLLALVLLGYLVNGLLSVRASSLRDETVDVMLKSATGEARTEEIENCIQLLESQRFLEQIRTRLGCPPISEAVSEPLPDIQRLEVKRQGKSSVIRIFVKTTVRQPEKQNKSVLAFGRRWKVSDGFHVKPSFYKAVFSAVLEEYVGMMREVADRKISERLQAFDTMRRENEQEQRNAREELDALRRKFSIFPPDNQTDTMRQVRLLEQNQMDLSISIQVLDKLRQESPDGFSEEKVKELNELKNKFTILQQEHAAKSKDAKEELGALSRVESLQKRIETLSGQLIAGESQIRELRTAESDARVQLIRLN